MAAPANRQEFAALVNQTRQRMHLSIRAVARIAQVPATTAQGWLNGKHFPTPALRGNYQLLVDGLGLADQVPADLWEDAWAGPPPALHSGRSPYLGLRPFRVSDQELFYGRAVQSRRVAEAILALGEAEGAGILALVGPSGSGKSSLLAAGVLGQEMAEGALAGWTGSSASVLRLAAGDGVVPPGEPGRRLLVVDQFEEAMLLPVEPKRRFMETLAKLATEAVVVIGMRSDAYGAASLEPVLEVAMSRPILLPPMTTEELTQVILKPAESFGVVVEDELVRALLRDVAPTTATNRVVPGALPLLSSALLLTWAVSDGRRLRLADYDHAGGVASAVERLAEQVYQSLEPEQQSATERLFLRLVRVTGDVLVHETLPLSEVEEAALPAMRAFVTARMLTTIDGGLRISHQALLTHWQRLQDWLEEHRDDLAVMEKLRRAAEVWTDSDRDPAALIPVQRFAVFTEWVGSGRKQRLLSDVEREFVATSEAHYANVLGEERAVSRRLRRRGSVAIALAALGLAISLIAGFLFVQGRGLQAAADQARNEAQSRQIATIAGTLRSQDPNLQAQMSVLADRLANTTESGSALLDATANSLPTRWLGPADAVLTTSPDGRTTVRGDGSGQVTYWRTDQIAAHPGASFKAAPEAISGIAAGSSDGRTLVAVTGAHTQLIWDITGDPVRAMDLAAGSSGMTDWTTVAFSPDGDRVAFGSVAGQIELWSINSGRLWGRRELRLAADPEAGPVAVTSLVFDHTHLYAAGQGGRLARWRLGTAPQRLPDLAFDDYRSSGARQLAVSRDGSQLAAAMAAKSVLRWRLTGDKATPDTRITETLEWVNSVAYSADGTQLIAGGQDQLTRVFDSGTGALLRSLPGPSEVTGVAFAGPRPVATSADGTLRSWPASDPRWRLGGSELYNLSTDATAGKWLAGGTPHDGIQLWRLDGEPTRVPTPVSGLPVGVQTGAVAVAPSGAYLLGATVDGRLLSWRLGAQGADRLTTVDVSLGYISFVQVAPDSGLVVAMEDAGFEFALLRADAEGGLVEVAKVPAPKAAMVWFSADSRTLAVAMPDHRIVLWDVTDPARPVEAGAISGLGSAPTSITFAPRSALLAVGTESGQVSVWDVADPARPVRTRAFGDPHAAPASVLFSPDERTLVATSGDALIWGWDLTRPDDGPLFTLSGDLGRPWDARFLSGDRLAVSGGNGNLQLWQLNEGAAGEAICAHRGDQLSAEEWNRYLPGITVADPCRPR